MAQSPTAAPPNEEAKAETSRQDDPSVPPVGFDAAFFDQEPAFSADSSLEIDTRDPRTLIKLTPLVARRRAHLARYVTAAVGFASILCAAAVVKITVARGHESLPRATANRPATTTTIVPLNPGATTEQAAPPPRAVISATGENGAAAEGTVFARPDSVSGAEVAAAVPPTSPPEGATIAAIPAQTEAPTAKAETLAAASAETPAADMAPLDPKAQAKEAGKQKAKARGALEWGKMGDAIAAGERSVAIDPTDAETWLILGAAYQQKGDAKNAFRSFRACLDQGKRGPRNECAAMMH